MSIPFIRLVLIGPGYIQRSIDQPFFPFIIETKIPGGVLHRSLPDHIVQMSLIPAFLSFFLPPPFSIYSGQAYPQQCSVGEGGDPRFARGLFHPPLEEDEVPVVPKLGIDQGHQQQYGKGSLQVAQFFLPRISNFPFGISFGWTRGKLLTTASNFVRATASRPLSKA